MLLALNHAFDRESMNLLIYLYRTKNDTIWYSGDGVLRFAGLMAAGLVQFGSQTVATPFQITQSSHQIHLSQKGSLLVEVWLAGDEEKYRELLMSSDYERRCLTRVPADWRKAPAARGTLSVGPTPVIG